MSRAKALLNGNDKKKSFLNFLTIPFRLHSSSDLVSPYGIRQKSAPNTYRGSIVPKAFGTTAGKAWPFYPCGQETNLYPYAVPIKTSG